MTADERAPVDVAATIAALRKDIGPPWSDPAKERKTQAWVSVAELRALLDELDAARARLARVSALADELITPDDEACAADDHWAHRECMEAGE